MFPFLSQGACFEAKLRSTRSSSQTCTSRDLFWGLKYNGIVIRDVQKNSSGKPHSVTVGKNESFKYRLSLPVETFWSWGNYWELAKALIHYCLYDCRDAQTTTSLCATGVCHTNIFAGQKYKQLLRLQARSSKWSTFPLLKAVLKSLGQSLAYKCNCLPPIQLQNKWLKAAES